MHQSLIGPFGSGFFPIFVFLLSSSMAVVAATLFNKIDRSTILLMLHVASALYGLFVGSFGDFSTQILTRRLGQVNLLLQLPHTFPLSFKRIMALFYIKDALYYLFYSYVPLIAGLAVASPLAKISLGSVALLGVTMLLTFLMGMGVSFLLSALSVRSRKLTLALSLTIITMISLVWPFGFLKPRHLLLPLGYWSNGNSFLLFISLIIAVLLASLGVLTVKQRGIAPMGRHETKLLPTRSRFSFAESMSSLLAKEWLELLRSGAMAQVILGFVGLISGVYFVIWLIEGGIGISLPFNVVSYSGLVGLMGVMTYSWVTSVDSNEGLNALPITVDQVVKAKIVLNMLLTMIISTVFVTLVGLMRNEVNLLPLCLLVVGASTIYPVVITAFLTGLWTNVMFFDIRVLIKFSMAVVPLLTVIEFSSLFIWSNVSLAIGALVVISIVQIVLSIPIIQKLKQKWERNPFSYNMMS